MPFTCRSRLALPIAVALLTACATGSGARSPAGRSDAPVSLGAARWMSPVAEAGECDPKAATTPPPAPSPALERNDPWLGAIGIRQWLSDSAEIGFGVALRKPVWSDVRTPALADIVRDPGVGIWLTFDF